MRRHEFTAVIVIAMSVSCGAASRTLAADNAVLSANLAKDLIEHGEFTEAAERLAPAVAQHQPDALMLQGVLAATGAGVPYDFPAALRFWQEAAFLGQSEAAKLYYGSGLNEHAHEWWKQRIARMPASTTGLPHNLVKKGQRGLEVDRTGALSWILRASAADDPVGLYNAYQAAQFGARSPAAKARVRKLLQRAATAGLPEALMDLSAEYEQSLPEPDGLAMGFPRDRNEAADLMRRAAEQGDARAQLLWAHWLASDKRQFKDKMSAARFYELAAKQGNAYAAYFLYVAYDEGKGVPKDTAQSERYLAQAAAGGMDTAVNIYAWRLFYGRGLPADRSRAVEMLEHTAVTTLTPDANGLALIAYAYATGAGVARSLTTAKWWCDWAVDEGSDYARKLQGQLAEAPISPSANK